MKLTKMHQYREYEIIEARKNPNHPKHKMPVTVGIKCPNCGKPNKSMQYEETRECVSCGVNLERKGNILQYTIEEESDE